ncbi:MAG TPA: hypothetical protein VNN77_09925 [candidate division Zixibacteria bacterium]|nr:hypothetical protein [candidate division Zixibacteria bacterium]
MSESRERGTVGGSTMRVDTGLPGRLPPAPAVIVAQGQSAADEFLQIARMISPEGYAAAPDLFHPDPLDAPTTGRLTAPVCGTRSPEYRPQDAAAPQARTFDFFAGHPGQPCGA